MELSDSKVLKIKESQMVRSMFVMMESERETERERELMSVDVVVIFGLYE